MPVPRLIANPLFAAPLLAALLLAAAAAPHARGASLVRLNESNWDDYAPAGKEVDCIYGDYVLRSDRLMVVVADPVATRNANLTVRGVGGSVIDLTRRDAPNDQLGCFFPHGGGWTFELAEPVEPVANARSVGLTLTGTRGDNPLVVRLTYTLTDGEESLRVVSQMTNGTDAEARVGPRDGVRADGEFQTGLDEATRCWWAEDDYWRQAYGVAPEGAEAGFRLGRSRGRRGPTLLRYPTPAAAAGKLAPGASVTVARRVFVGANRADVIAWARRLRGRRLIDLEAAVADAAGPVARARVEAFDPDGESHGGGRTDAGGRLRFALPPGEYTLRATSQGREDLEAAVTLDAPRAIELAMTRPGLVVAAVTNGAGEPIPCKVAFKAIDGGTDPDFGPDSAVRGVRNLQYTPDGVFRAPLAPGRYAVIVSHGPEHDLVSTELVVAAGQETPLKAVLRRSIDTTGWLSADFHSHSSPSGDNTSEQRGRVLNLLAEHIEFAPCTEHNRISTYTPHLEFFDAEARMATCSGIELTGRPLPLNHQNAFPLKRTPRVQDGGGPTTDVDPVVQIERLAMWDDGAHKLVQTNHPNLVQMLADRDLNRVGDGGFRGMFGWMDVVEVHPPGRIFTPPTELYPRDRGERSVIFNWMQLLNTGLRVPGVVNTDSHWNYHGSGWLRNYLRSPTDDPAEAQIADLVTASERGAIVMTNGPFLEVRATNAAGEQAGPGADLAAGGGQVSLAIRVQCANWLDVNRVQVFVNGRPAPELNFTRSKHPEVFGQRPVVFEADVPVELDTDAHLIVAAAGIGLRLGPVYGEEQGERMPVAVANPIYVDVDGNSFQANGDQLGLPLPAETDESATPSRPELR